MLVSKFLQSESTGPGLSDRLHGALQESKQIASATLIRNLIVLSKIQVAQTFVRLIWGYLTSLKKTLVT